MTDLVLCGELEEDLVMLEISLVCKRRGLKVNAYKEGRKDWSVRFLWMRCNLSMCLRLNT